MTKPFMAICFELVIQDGTTQAIILSPSEAEDLRSSLAEGISDATGDKALTAPKGRRCMVTIYPTRWASGPGHHPEFRGAVIPVHTNAKAAMDYLEGLECPSPVT